MKNKLQKRYQRKFNKIIRAVNENIKNDSLWQGRFWIEQLQSNFEKFNDGSGGILYIELCFHDRKSDITKNMWINYMPSFIGTNWKIFVTMNNFIVEDCDAWGRYK